MDFQNFFRFPKPTTVITLTSRYNFGREKSHSTSLELARPESKIKIVPSWQDCLVAKITALNSSDQVLIIMVEFFLSWTRTDGRKIFYRKLVLNTFSCLRVMCMSCAVWLLASFLTWTCDLHLPACLLH